MKSQRSRQPVELIDSTAVVEGIDQMLVDARDHFQSGQLSKAEAVYRRILQCDSDNSEAIHFLGLICDREGNRDKASELIRKALDLNPRYAEAYVSLGIVRQNQGHLVEAADCFRQALTIRPDYVDAHNNLGVLYLNQGLLGEAAESFQQALAINPDYVDANNNLGVIFLNQGSLKNAEKYFRRAIELKPDHADAHNNLGVVYLNQGQSSEAAECFQKLLEVKPDHADAYNNLGVIFLSQGRLSEAEEYFNRTIEVKQDHADARNNLGVVCLRRGQSAKAVEHLRQAILFKPDYVDAYNNLGKALLTLGELRAAEECYRKLVSIKPQLPDAQNDLGVALLNQGQLIEAAECFRKAIAFDPDLADAHNNLGAVFLNQRRLLEAEECLHQALKIDPKHANAQNNLGQVLQQQGRISAAAERFRKVIRLCPNHAEAYRHLVNCCRIKPGDKEILQMESLIRQTHLNENDRISLGFALGKVYDDIREYDAAFSTYEQANRLLRAQLEKGRKHFDLNQLEKHVDDLIAAYSERLVANPFQCGSDTDLPIFIVGMFRSGTSLVEQIISSHSRVCGAGELKNISTLVRSLPSRLGGIPYPECISRLDRYTLAKLADDYLGYVREIGGSIPYVVDKMPNNIWHLGLISLLFPKARIIHCRRDPRDICLSCFFQRFTDEGTYHTTDLLDCGRFYLESERLMKHWRSVLRSRILQVDYEALVANQEAESRRIIEFLGLEWEPDCLEFYRTKRDVATASVWQVRQPVYKRSAGKWRHYQRHLKTLLDVLEHAK